MVRNENVPWKRLSVEAAAIVGSILLAFAIDAWWEERNLQAVLVGNLSGLSYDFATNRAGLIDVSDRHGRSVRAIEDILILGSDPGNELDHDEFYRRMREVNITRKFSVVRRTYDSLISAGLVESIPSEDLKRAIAGFYNFVKRIEHAQEDMQAIQTFILEPYISKNLDHAALMVVTHPEAGRIRPSRPANQFRDIIGTDEFEGVLVTKWHISQDLTNLYSSALDQIDTVDNLIQQIAGQQVVIDKSE